MPVSTTFVATATPTVPPNVIDNLEDGDTYLNPAMCGTTANGVPSGFWVASSWGPSSNVVNGKAGAAYVFCGNVGANGTSCAIHVFGTLTDAGDAKYPAFQLEGKLRGGLYFDSSVYGFKGVQFYYKTGNDTCPTRRFNLGVASTTPPVGGGYDTVADYNHYGAVLIPTTNTWVQKSYYFQPAAQGGGSPTLAKANGAGNLSNTDLKQMLEVEWVFTRNNLAGNNPVDYWVDEVQFF